VPFENAIDQWRQGERRLQGSPSERRPQLERVTAALPMGRMGEPGEVAHLVAFLASEQAGYVTGQTIEISGGGDLNLLSLGSARQD